MKIGIFDEKAVIEAASLQFPSQYIEYVISDLFVSDIENGVYVSDLVEGTLFISTNYAYQKEIVQGNLTNVKVKISCILVKDDKYQVIYDSTDCYYAVVMGEDCYEFMPYQIFLETISKSMKKIEENINEG